jgi:hypothetical protein
MFHFCSRSQLREFSAMGAVTYFVVQPFGIDEEGQIYARSEAMEAQSAASARRTARMLSEKDAGAIAFSRTGNPATGEFDDAIVLGCYGKVAEFGVPVMEG